MDKTAYKKLVQLGKTNPSLRPHIRPVLAACKQASAGTLKSYHEDYAMNLKRFIAKELKRVDGVVDADPDVLGSLNIEMMNGTDWDIAVSAGEGTKVEFFKNGKRYDTLQYWEGTRLNEIVVDVRNIVLR